MIVDSWSNLSDGVILGQLGLSVSLHTRLAEIIFTLFTVSSGYLSVAIFFTC